jgi:hypothetical protein
MSTYESLTYRELDAEIACLQEVCAILDGVARRIATKGDYSDFLNLLSDIRSDTLDHELRMALDELNSRKEAA